jgi:hypothetical protein
MTISHPPKVKTCDKNILASGIDTLVISLNVQWNDESIFGVLDDLKEKSQQFDVDCPGNLKHFQSEDTWYFNIKPNGTKGFSWILAGSDFTYRIANALKPSSRPNIMVEIRSEALWRLGPAEVIKIALGIIQANGAVILEAKISRLDLCLDFLMPEDLWAFSLMEFAVTRATDFNPYYRNMNLTGIRIGKGEISARMYDKPLEIKQQSRKTWMFDVWKIEEVPEGYRIIRIEFQLRREVLKEIGLKSIDDLLPKIDGAWAYCTKKWLKFQDRPKFHHTQRRTLEWYQEIQDGFNGVQGAEPLVRNKAVQMDKKRLVQQANGLIAALHAIMQEETGKGPDEPVKGADCLATYAREFYTDASAVSKIEEKVKKNRSRYHRERPIREPGQLVYVIKRDTSLSEHIEEKR